MSLLRQRARLTRVLFCCTTCRPLLTRSPFISCQRVASAEPWFQAATMPGVNASSPATARDTTPRLAARRTGLSDLVGCSRFDIGWLQFAVRGPSRVPAEEVTDLTRDGL